jgi:uncharacterized membrane protein YdjX (TVP38/TMEM64 family)
MKREILAAILGAILGASACYLAARKAIADIAVSKAQERIANAFEEIVRRDMGCAK